MPHFEYCSQCYFECVFLVSSFLLPMRLLWAIIVFCRCRPAECWRFIAKNNLLTSKVNAIKMLKDFWFELLFPHIFKQLLAFVSKPVQKRKESGEFGISFPNSRQTVKIIRSFVLKTVGWAQLIMLCSTKEAIKTRPTNHWFYCMVECIVNSVGVWHPMSRIRMTMQK